MSFVANFPGISGRGRVWGRPPLRRAGLCAQRRDALVERNFGSEFVDSAEGGAASVGFGPLGLPPGKGAPSSRRARGEFPGVAACDSRSAVRGGARPALELKRAVQARPREVQYSRCQAVWQCWAAPLLTMPSLAAPRLPVLV